MQNVWFAEPGICQNPKCFQMHPTVIVDSCINFVLLYMIEANCTGISNEICHTKPVYDFLFAQFAFISFMSLWYVMEEKCQGVKRDSRSQFFSK